METSREEVRESSQGQEIFNKLLKLIKEKKNGIQTLDLLIIIPFTVLVNSIMFSFVCTVNSSLEVFRPGLLTPYLHSDYLMQIYSAGSNHLRQTRLLPLFAPRSNQEGDWKCIPSRQMYTSHPYMAGHTAPNTLTQHNDFTTLPSLAEGPLGRMAHMDRANPSSNWAQISSLSFIPCLVLL